MSTYISLLRAVNIGGTRLISMDALRALYTGMGFDRVRTYIQSGNAVFASHLDDLSQLASQVEAGIEQAFGFHVEVFIRRPQDFLHLLTHNPFLNERHADPSRLYLTLIYQSPSEDAWGNLSPPAQTGDEFARADQAVYLYLPNGYARTRLSNRFFEKTFGTPTTTRNWNTFKALYEIANTP
ncbi:MAG: DUF1697 domain-containing protein, partial [Acidobacteriaceae bacterium]